MPAWIIILQQKCVPNNCGSCSGNAICELVDFKTFECVPCQIGQLVSSDRTKCLENACLTNCKAISTDYECVEEFGSFACDCKIGFRYSRQQQRCLQSTCQECQNINSTLCILKQNNTFGCICADQKMLFRDSKCIPNCEIINGVSAFCNEQGVCGLNGQCVCNNNLNTEQNCASCVEGAFILDEKCISPSCGTQSHCNGRGICEKGFCRCHFGYIGSDCQQCIPGFIEVAGVCGSPSCQMEIGQCSGMGKCQNSICQCLKQNHGVDCEECHEGFIKAIDGTVVHCINLKNASNWNWRYIKYPLWPGTCSYNSSIWSFLVQKMQPQQALGYGRQQEHIYLNNLLHLFKYQYLREKLFSY
ncbi:Cysteine-rich protein [Spironucleus salmonicida]|uniref:Cysteine-rich protein n=1 Tax=Spironucleus salmonicida TaxID=348837 RepID=A0A9P8LJS8_9EUKA|nr:Cysteine-rich protein [Spironucleus salmonicida]